MQSFLIVALGLAILTVIFALRNTIPVGVTVLVWKFEGSLALVLMLTFALGVLVSLLLSIPAIVKKQQVLLNLCKNAVGRPCRRRMPNREGLPLRSDGGFRDQ
jgi:uncharacterized integral membrane protein